MKIVTATVSTSSGWVWWLMPVTSTQESMVGGFRIKSSYRVASFY